MQCCATPVALLMMVAACHGNTQVPGYLLPATNGMQVQALRQAPNVAAEHHCYTLWCWPVVKLEFDPAEAGTGAQLHAVASSWCRSLCPGQLWAGSSI
jgi:hypothetical protein